MRRGDPLYRLVLREEIRLGTLAYAGLAGSRPVQAVIVRAVLAVLLSDANRAGVCWPSLRRISECAEVSRVSATRALSALEARGLIRRERRAFSPEDGRKGRSTVYRLQWAALEALAGMDSASPGSAPGVRCASHGYPNQSS